MLLGASQSLMQQFFFGLLNLSNAASSRKTTTMLTDHRRLWQKNMLLRRDLLERIPGWLVVILRGPWKLVWELSRHCDGWAMKPGSTRMALKQSASHPFGSFLGRCPHRNSTGPEVSERKRWQPFWQVGTWLRLLRKTGAQWCMVVHHSLPFSSLGKHPGGATKNRLDGNPTALRHCVGPFYWCDTRLPRRPSVKLVAHVSYTSDLAPYDVFLFLMVKGNLCGWWFLTPENAVIAYHEHSNTARNLQLCKITALGTAWEGRIILCNVRENTLQ